MNEVLCKIINNDFYKLFISGFLLPIVVSFITFIISDILKRKKNKTRSKNIIFEEIKRINEISEDFHSQAAQNIDYLLKSSFDKVVSVVLTGMYTVYSDQEWISYVNILKNELSSIEYAELTRYHKIYTNIDFIYPIKSYKDKIEDNKNELLKWWKATENIYTNKQIKEMKSVIDKALTKK